jgi:hypothetical protein
MFPSLIDARTHHSRRLLISHLTRGRFITYVCYISGEVLHQGVYVYILLRCVWGKGPVKDLGVCIRIDGYLASLELPFTALVSDGIVTICKNVQQQIR